MSFNVRAPRVPFLDTSVTSTAELMVAGPTLLHQIHCDNIDATDGYVQLFDAVIQTDVTLGTTVPTFAIFIPAGNATLRGAVTEVFAEGLSFKLGIVYAVTTTISGSSAQATVAPVSAVYS